MASLALQQVCLVISIAAFVVFLIASTHDDTFFATSYSKDSTMQQGMAITPGNHRDAVLASASDGGKNVILASLNKAWAEEGALLDIFLGGFRSGNKTAELLENLVLVSLDEVAHQRCLAIHKHCLLLETSGVDFSSREALFMSRDFVWMMKRRVEFLGEVLELGYNFIFTDLDVLWLRNPWNHLNRGAADIAVSCDVFHRGNASRSKANTGFIHARSNARTIKLYKFWASRMEQQPGKNEQQVFNAFRSSPEFGALEIRVDFLPTSLFSNFGDVGARDMGKIVTMHANCCKGMAAKLADLKLTMEDWQDFMASPVQEKRFRFRAPDSCKRSWEKKISM
ncbi:uncharacterized protein At1g28695-like isoform X1 [Selaginella moellendorffii]|uniref:uncharacterized protein At1g28695-like isoform X1 n=1 Tax=Selaginella moellendorffii TaxID=88036 RepID=UPI000D1C2A2D|nr:uncharacterized protein At1g28695-like isoform X1 [Selaginella moellendorffii]|eukprot:XP_024521522.1 uncharacterized protein At1g28695-like isoform X1 [Selaginella moellendorffii]